MVSGFRPDIRLQDIELAHVFFECVGIQPSYIPYGFFLGSGAFFYLIVAAICVISEVTDVSDIHDMVD